MPPRPALLRTATVAAAAALAVAALPAATASSAPWDPAGTPPLRSLSAPGASVALSVVASHASGEFGSSAAEIVAHDPKTQRLFVVNAQRGQVEVLDQASFAPTGDQPVLARLVTAGAPAADGSTVDVGAVANSVAMRSDGLVAVAVEAADKVSAGWVVFFDGRAKAPTALAALRVGSLPDMLVFSPDGKRLLVANEAEPADDYFLPGSPAASDPVGSISVIDVSTPAVRKAKGASQSLVRTAGFEAYEAGGTRPLPEGVRVFGTNPEHGSPVARSLEPEYLTVSADGRTAWATLQEANAIAVVDLASATVRDLLPLGTKDHAAPGNELDPSNRDGGARIASWPVRGLYQPDAITSYTAGGATYLVTANEGDAREWTVEDPATGEDVGYVEAARVKDLAEAGRICEGVLTPEQLADPQLGRLNVSTASGLRAGADCFEELHAFGARSFSIWTAEGDLVFDSGSDLERITARALPDGFNASNDDQEVDGRSDDKGPEPEGVVVGKVGSRTYAFVGLERVGGLAVYDVTDPAAARFATYANARDFTADLDTPQGQAQAGDLGPEGLAFITAANSPTGQPLVAVGNEVSGTTTLYAVTDLTPPRGGRGR